MTAERTAKTRTLLYGIVALLSLFAGLCTVFVLVVTAAEGWQEHSQSQWLEATATIESCRMRQTSTGQRRGYYVDCQLSYVAGNERVLTRLYSRTVPSPEVWQYPRRDLYGQFEEWVNQHPPGTQIAVRYDPAKPGKAVLLATDTPFGGPHTPNNLKLLEFMAAIFIVLVAIARIARPRSTEVMALRT